MFWVSIDFQGKVLSQGTPVDVCNSIEGLSKLIGVKESEDTEMKGSRNRSKSIASAYEVVSQFLADAKADEKADAKGDEKDAGVEMEASSKGTVKGVLLAQYFTAGAHWSVFVILLIGCLFVQFFGSAADYWVSIW